MTPTEEDLAWFRSTFHPIPKAALPDDCVEYSIYTLSASLNAANDSELRLRLREIQKYSAELQRQWLKDYIWQRQGFNLELQKEDGVSYLRGVTEYGDSIEDEWVIIWLLRELSKKFKDAWVKVTDSDGEFLLIEASGSLPPWLQPDVAENRVWINDGQLKIIKPAKTSKSSKSTDEKVSTQDAQQILLHEPKRLLYSIAMEEEAFYRLRNYPSQIKTNMHHALARIPRKIAFLLQQKAAYIAPVIEAFYLRDPIAMKPLNSNNAMTSMIFPPTDLVTVSIRFPKVGYAQLKSQDFPPPTVFQDSIRPKTESKVSGSVDTGIKITCGFEMLVTDTQHQDKPAVREIKLLLDDLDTGDENLPSDTEIGGWTKQEDDETWLDIDFADLEEELGGHKGDTGGGKRGNFGDRAAQENLQRIVKQFDDFIRDDKAGPDGAGLFDEHTDDDQDDDNLDDEEESTDGGGDASFDEDEFSKMMQEMMGMPPDVMKEIIKGELGSGSRAPQTKSAPKDTGSGRAQEVDDSSDEGDEDMEQVMKQMEVELREHGALNLNTSSTEIGSGKRALKGIAKEPDTSENDDDGENDVDVNLVRNLLESFKAQSGASGPGGSMMGLMGLNMPRDDEDATSGAGGPSRRKPKD